MCSDFIGHLLPSQFCLKQIFLPTLTPEMHAVAQEKWGGERGRESAFGGEGRRESKVEKPPLLFEAMTLSLVEVVHPFLPSN